jgi:hypothetical protein
LLKDREATWRKYLTMPKVLKDFNPKLAGYSVRDSLDLIRHSKFNVSETIAMNKDIHFAAQLLIRRMKADKDVDFCNDWNVGVIMHVYRYYAR